MTYAALAQAVALLTTVLGFLRHLRGLQRQHDRRVDLLTDKVLHLAGHTWTQPPREDDPIPVIPPRDLELVEPGEEPDF